MRLALFDLDHTLIPFDSGMAWTRYLVQAGVWPADAEDRYLAFCHQYVAGTLDIHAMHRASVAPLAQLPAAQLQNLRQGFEQAIEARLPGDMKTLVARHRAAGDLCAIVTATSRIVAEPFARAFGVAHLVATNPQMQDGVPTGEIEGLPCYAQHKLRRVQSWLAESDSTRLQRSLHDFAASWFYSDSASDLPLLQAVSHPVAVRPDARLRAHALAAGWHILEGGAEAPEASA